MSRGVIDCRKGDPCGFIVRVRSGIDGRYVRARFQVRAAWDETLPALLAVDSESGAIVISSGMPGEVAVQIGATLTDQLPRMTQPREVAAQLRLYAADADDRMSFAIPFQLLPDVINDA